MIFTLPKRFVSIVFTHVPTLPQYFVYVEWFSLFQQSHTDHNMHKISRSMFTYGGQRASIVLLASIRRSIHLFPCFRDTVPREWASSTVLEKWDKFLVSSFYDRHAYGTIY